MVRQLYPEGNAQTFVGKSLIFYFHHNENISKNLYVGHIMRVFDTDGNGKKIQT